MKIWYRVHLLEWNRLGVETNTRSDEVPTATATDTVSSNLTPLSGPLLEGTQVTISNSEVNRRDTQPILVFCDTTRFLFKKQLEYVHKRYQIVYIKFGCD
jgi:hypothetical protein